MIKVNLNDRRALELAYPAHAFVADAAHNAAAAAETVNGVRVLSAPDAAGVFTFERGSRQVAEAGSAAFLAPYRRLAETEAGGAAPSDPPAGYEAFLDTIVDAAQRFGYRPEQSPGQGDPRIRGLRQ